MNAHATIGHNSDPFAIARDSIADALDEARLWLDGAEVASPEQADGLAGVLDMLRKAHKAADEARKVEAKPFDDGKAEVQGRYVPLLTDADRAVKMCKAALAKWQAAQKRKADEVARIAREAADRAAQEASDARRKVDMANLAEREKADAAIAEAGRLAKAADAAEKAPTGAKGMFAARRTALIISRVPVELIDGKAAVQWAMRNVPDELTGWLLQQAKSHKAGDVPGVRYEEQETVR